MKTALTLSACLLATASLSAQSGTTRSIGNPNLGAFSTLSADTWSGTSAGGSCEAKLRNRATGNTLVLIDGRFRRQGTSYHNQRTRLYIGDTMLHYDYRTSTRLLREDATESISSFETQTIRRSYQNVTGGEAGTGGSLVDTYHWVSTTIGARGQLMAASARNGTGVGADADFRTWAWCSDASVGAAPATIVQSSVDTTMNIQDRLWFSMVSTFSQDGGTLHAMPQDNYVHQEYTADGFFFPDVRRTPTGVGIMIPIPYPMIFFESATLVDDTKHWPHRIYSVN